MNDDEYDGFSFEEELTNHGIKRERQALAATLTRLRANHLGDNPENRGYLAALENVAQAHGLRADTIVRYIA
jgi:hypothetical protein